MTTLYLEKSLGIDFREGSAGLTLLGKRFRGIEVIGFHHFRTGSLDTGDEEAQARFLEETDRFLMEQDHPVCTVAVTLPRERISFQFFELPAPDLNVLDSMIGFELERHFSSRPEDLFYAYHAVRVSDSSFHIALAAVRKDTANRYLQLLDRLSLKPSVLDVSTFTNFNLVAVNGHSSPPATALVDLSSTGFEICILHQGRLQVSRPCTLKDAAVKNAYFDPEISDRAAGDLSARLSQDILNEIETTLSSCDAIESGADIEQIYLFNGGPYAQALEERLEKSSTVATARVIPPFHLSPGLKPGFPSSHLATAFSLAARELRPGAIVSNLLPPGLRPRKKRTGIKTTLVLTCLLLILGAGFLASRIIYKNLTLASLDEQLKEVQTVVKPYETIDLRYEELKQYAGILTAVHDRIPGKLPLLQELTRILPPNTWVKDLSFKKGGVEIRGFSSSASNLIPLIEKSPHFKNAGFRGSIVKTPEGEKFAIRADLEGKSR